MEKAGSSRGFRPRGKTAERLEYADRLGINVSELVNEVLDAHLKDALKRRIERQKETLEKALEAPIP